MRAYFKRVQPPNGPAFTGGIGWIDLHHGQHRRDWHLDRDQVSDFLFDHVADHALGLGAENIEWEDLVRLVGRALQRKQAHLGTVAVRHDQFVPGMDLCELGRREFHIGALNFGRHRFATPQQGISTQGNKNTHA